MDFYDRLSSTELLQYLDGQLELHVDEDMCLTSHDIIRRTEKFLNGSLLPGPPKRCQINKMGSSKKRTIYIFPAEDQWVLKAIHFCLSRCDLKLLPCCLAFRPGFHVHGAFHTMIRKAGPEYSCIRLDIRNYFNSIPTQRLIRVIEKCFASYPELVSALTMLLQDTRIIENGALLDDYGKGVMAGMPLAPLLANLYLSDFDVRAVAWAPAYGRYSDDLIFFCPPEDVAGIYEKAEKSLTELGLALNEDKSRIVPPGGKWEFLGLSYHKGIVDLSDASIRKMKGKISRSARKLFRWKVAKNASTERAVRALIRKFQYKFYGSGRDDDELTWSRWYFPLITHTDGLRTIDRYFQLWARYLADGRHSKMNFRQVPYALLKEYGYVPLVSAFHKRERDPAGKSVELQLSLTQKL